METPETRSAIPKNLKQAVSRGPTEVQHFLAEKFNAVLLAASTEEESALIMYLWRIVTNEDVTR